jgi:hypothetical protein
MKMNKLRTATAPHINRWFSAAVVAAVAIVTGGISRADTMGYYPPIVAAYTLTLTEVSSTLLTYTYTNPTDPTPFTITQGIGGGSSPDTWTVSIDPMSGITLISAFTFDFAEGPGEPSNELNRVQGGSGSPFNNQFSVNSDLTIGSNGIVTSVKIGTDDGVDIFLQYVDLAAASETAAPGVPDTGSTLGLMAMAMGITAVAGSRRFQSLRAS